MKQTSFKKVGWLYLSIRETGMLITLGAISFMVMVCMSVFRRGDSVSDDLYKTFVYPTCTAFWWKWSAEKTSY
ncbi:MAG TPA: hypothetical protein VJ111_10140 [Chitinophagaceae bacterium]|nr:hypothetical protein [Chitinophagaceae bacterium]